MTFSQKLKRHRIFKRLAKALIRLCVCTCWSEALLVAHTILLEISCGGSNVLRNFLRFIGESMWLPLFRAYTSYSRSRNSPACSLHIYWYSVRLSSLLPFYKICMIFQLSSAYSTHQAEENKHFSPFFGVKLTMPPSSGYSTHLAQLTTYAT